MVSGHVEQGSSFGTEDGPTLAGGAGTGWELGDPGRIPVDLTAPNPKVEALREDRLHLVERRLG
jgi:hypothetical protein